MHGYSTRSVRLLAVPLLLTGAVAGIFSLTAAAARTGPAAPAASFTIRGTLRGVAATSASNAWAVGCSTSCFTDSGKTLIEQWNGTSWKQVPSPGPAGSGLFSVAATSARSAWAVGETITSTGSRTLILRWNGKVWTPVPSPSPGADAGLSGVAATSATNAWVVGAYYNGTTDQTLISHWNGTAWKRVPSQGASSGLSSVAATSAGNAWAVGDVVNSNSSATGLILHWNGKAWKRVPSPVPADGKYGNALAGVAAASAASAWAVGCTDGCPVGGTPVIERWSGTAWKQVAPPTTPYSLYDLVAVAATSSTSAWAVGGGGPVTSEGTATTQWNGRRWTLSPGRSGAELTGVSAISATNAWAVGGTASGHTLILHWNGTTWKSS